MTKLEKKTLVADINNNQDTTLTAKSLHVHYIIDLSDSETLFKIQLLVKMNDILDCL